jgi:hypothetical protein
MGRIYIENPYLTNNKLINRFDIPSTISHLIRNKLFYVEYPEDVSDVPTSILNIPILSSIIHMAWATGHDVVIPEIDATYYNGLEHIRRILKSNTAYRSIPLNSKIYVTNIVENSFADVKKYGLLFSGGVDSTVSYIRHLHLEPVLYSIWGQDIATIPSWTHSLWGEVKKKYSWMGIHFLKTNSEEIYYPKELSFYGHKFIEGYRGGYSFIFTTIGVVAPLTYLHNIGTLLMSSTYPLRHYSNPSYPWANKRVNFLISQYMKWGDMKTYEVDNEFTKIEKIKYFIKPYFDEHGPLLLRVCGHYKFLSGRKDQSLINCGRCDKCQRVIGALTINDIDPNTCGFNITKETFIQIRKDIEEKRWNVQYNRYHWNEVKRGIPNYVIDIPGSREFFKWLEEEKI